ncbi:AAA family ATPase [Patescibacteria group bacterium]|nr:AAA family ATPase [Patescibacteria group bacterium]
MDELHYGTEGVKQIILEYLSVMHIKMAREKKLSFQPPVLLFVGDHGLGKTSLAKAISYALGRNFVRIPMGALSAGSELRGIPKGNNDAEPGQIIKSIVRSASLNPVILLDEIDKVSGIAAEHHNFMAILLEILDPQQNTSFRDLFIDFPIDLSHAFFICTANTTKTITDALLDRLEIISFNEYKPEEKIIIGKDYLLPRILKYTKMTSNEIQISESAWEPIVKNYAKEAGVRNLEKTIDRIIRKAALRIVARKAQSVTITPENLESYMDEIVPIASGSTTPESIPSFNQTIPAPETVDQTAVQPSEEQGIAEEVQSPQKIEPNELSPSNDSSTGANIQQHPSSESVGL